MARKVALKSGLRGDFIEIMGGIKKVLAEREMSKQQGNAIVLADRIERFILLIRGQRVILDADLAALYGTTTKVFT